MNLTDLWKPIVLFTGLLGLLTVGTVYLATYSGFAMVALAGAGVLLTALGGGAAGAADGSGVASGEGGFSGTEKGDITELEGTGSMPYTDIDTSLRLNIFLFGLGVLLWSLVVLFTLRDTLA